LVGVLNVRYIVVGPPPARGTVTSVIQSCEPALVVVFTLAFWRESVICSVPSVCSALVIPSH